MATGFIRQHVQVCVRAEMLMWVPWAKFKPRERHQESSFEDTGNPSKLQERCCKVVPRSDRGSYSAPSGTGKSCSCPPMPWVSPHVGPWAQCTKKAPASFVTGFFVSPHRSTKAEECYYRALMLHHPYLNQGALDYSRQSQVRQIKTSRSIRWAEGSSLAQSKGHCRMWVL